jgi:hypothetical protein
MLYMNRFKMLEKSREQMKTALGENKSYRIRVPRKSASYEELSRFFDRHDGVDLLDRGIMEIDPDREDLERMLLEYWSQPNTKQLNIRIPYDRETGDAQECRSFHAGEDEGV